MDQRSLARRTAVAALAALAVGLGVLVATGPFAEARPHAEAHARAAASPQHLRAEPLDIVTAKGVFRFKAEIADTDATREKGLMFRTDLAADQGMLFDFKTPRRVAFWMHNTYISLDLVFIGADGRVVSVARNAPVRNDTPIPGGGVVRAVLEIPAGRAAQIGLLPGDRVKHRIFPRG
ncbi:MAG: hypothetical protein JWP35_2340 [Caulobacter sp.]|nr:hypothetical protein [Caulobacter sp.]